MPNYDLTLIKHSAASHSSPHNVLHAFMSLGEYTVKWVCKFPVENGSCMRFQCKPHSLSQSWCKWSVTNSYIQTCKCEEADMNFPIKTLVPHRCHMLCLTLMRPTQTDQEIHAQTSIFLNQITFHLTFCTNDSSPFMHVMIYKYTLTIADHLTNGLKCFDEI